MVKPTDFVASYSNMAFYSIFVMIGGVFLTGLWLAILFVSIFTG